MKIINSNISRWFFIIVIPVLAIWTGVMITNTVNEKNFQVEKMISEAQINDANTSVLIERYMAEIIENLKVIRDADELNSFINERTPQRHDDLAQLFVRIMNNKIAYAQIRYINRDGQEVVRVENNNGVISVGRGELQNKADRYYFLDSIGLAYNQVYISPLDLNKENGAVEQPYKPMLRFSTPIYDANQQSRGIVIINYNAQKFIELLSVPRHGEMYASSSFYILNNEGKFIAHPDPDKNFSFMFTSTADLSLNQENESLWADMVANNFIGSKVENEHIYSYYDVLTDSQKNIATYKQRWILLHSQDMSDLLSWRTFLDKLFLTSNAIIFMVIIFLSYILAYIIDSLMFADRQLEISQKIANSTSDAVVITDTKTRITYVNKAYEEATGYQLDEIIGAKTGDFKSDKHDAAFYQKMWHDINEKDQWEGMLWDRRKDGLLCLKKLKILAVRNKKNNTLDKYVGIFTDMSANRMKSDTFDMLKLQDGQMLIPNENMMVELLDQSIKNKDFSFTIIYLAIENFNRIVSLFDEDNRYVSEVFTSLIQPFIQEGDVVAQTGRNLFAVIVGMNHIDEEREDFVKHLHKELSKVIHLNGRDIFFKTRIGVSYWPQDTNDIKKLLLNSMVALEWTTRRHESEIAFFNERMIAELNQENEIEGRLRKAVENGELSMVYQPQIDIVSEQLVGMEALLRWHNDVLGNISPAVFIPIAEKSNLMVDIGNWIIQAVCSDLQTIKRDCDIAALNLRCAINISALQMAEEDFATKFLDCIDANNIEYHEVELEITESSLLNNEDQSIEILKQIRNKGISIAIDDFGTGYSSLSYLHTLPLDKIKIDRSFIKNYPNDDDGTLAKILVDMSKTLQMKVLTEGAETKEQIDYLRSIGCDYIQGYYYSKPLMLEQFIDYAKTK